MEAHNVADEPERRVVGVLAVALEQQAGVALSVKSGSDTNGRVLLTGQVDLVKLAKAVLQEVQRG